MFQVVGLDDLVQYGFFVIFEYLYQVVLCVVEVVQGGFVYVGCFGQFFQCCLWVVDDSDCQCFDELFVMGNQGYRWVLVGFFDCVYCVENWFCV